MAGVAIAVGLGFSLGAARYAGSGDGSIVEPALGAVDPLTRAGLAATMGDGKAVRDELGAAYSDAHKASKDELRSTKQRIDHIVKILEQTSPNDAPIGRLYADGFEELARIASPTPASPKNK